MTVEPQATNRSFWRRWLDQPFIRSIGGVGGAAGLSQLAAIAVAPILARLYPAEAFGQFGVIVAYCNIAAALLLFGLNDAILAADDEAAANQLLTAGVKISAVALVPAAIVSAFAVNEGYFGLAPLPIAALVVIVPLVFCLVLSSLLQASLARRLRFRPLAAGYIAMGWSRAAGQLAGGALGAAYGGLAGGELAGRAIACRTMAKGLAASWRDMLAMPRREWGATVRRYRHFPIQRTPSTLLSSIAVGMPVLMVTSLFGVGPGGQFSLMLTMLMGPVAIVQRAVGDTFVGHFGTRYRQDRGAGRRFAAGASVFALAGGAAAGAVLWLSGEWLFVLIFGPDWQVAGRMAALCAPWIALMLPVAALSQILIVTHRPGLKLLFDVAFVGGLAILQFLYQATARGDDALPFVRDLSLVCAAAYAFYIPLIAFALWRPGSVAAR
ncbi:lipopolysaccharide biosynthesis protein [Sphingopyxis sp. MSC1_008]|jgi:O-antigen/teichoic acid export membrane protein|uniref:lipopolysaccharide biosynthesis protein n=1 Tax=Sphingopyxis sp. MSC1_008 TaxID=2909265 RepID=UPI0020C12D6C|nr:oligosaccharide flippase family protein [Sphingopyxis sp. MSC1_008]